MSSASRLPEKLLKRWKAASKEGQRALTAFVKFSTEPLESVQQLQRITSTKAKIMQSVEECNIICDELGSAFFVPFFIFSFFPVVCSLVEWLERRRKSPEEINLECLSVLIEAYVNEASLRQQLYLGLNSKNSSDNATCLSKLLFALGGTCDLTFFLFF
jgi:hypothetical protein